MAKQMEGFIEGTIDDITFYKMGDEYYARMKSSLTRKRFFRDKAFEGSRRSFQRFGRGNQLASVVYNEIEKEKREYALFCRMRSVAIRMIKEGSNENEVMDGLREMKPIVRVKVIKVRRVISQFRKELNRRVRGGRRMRNRERSDVRRERVNLVRNFERIDDS